MRQALSAGLQVPRTVLVTWLSTNVVCLPQVFELQVEPAAEGYVHSKVVLNERTLTQGTVDRYERPYPIITDLGRLLANSTSGATYGIGYRSYSQHFPLRPEDETKEQRLRFEILSNGALTVESSYFDVYIQPSAERRLLTLSSPDPYGVDQTVDFRSFTASFASPGVSVESDHESIVMPYQDDASFVVEDELESLRLLETQAMDLRAQIVAKKYAISTHLKDDRDQVSLRHLLQECNGLVCAARVLAQRICDRVGMLTEPATGYVRTQSSYLRQGTVMFQNESGKPPQTSRNCTKSNSYAQRLPKPSKHASGSSQEMSVPLMMTKSSTTSTESVFREFVTPSNPLVRALQVAAAVLGIASLCAFIHRKCMSMRKRVERAADKEERRNRRAYRQAARRAEMRRQWDNFMGGISCFRAAPEPRIEDYEEKRALILQDAFMEQMDDLDQAEKGEIMEAEIRELRFAQEIVAGLVRVDEHRFALARPINDPPPPLVPLPYTPDTRSRASTYTLPSYTSDILPDYMSRAQTLGGSSQSGSVIDVFTHYSPSLSSDGEGRGTPPSITSSGGRTGYTPTSSVLDVSARASEETLRTRQSKDTQDR